MSPNSQKYSSQANSNSITGKIIWSDEIFTNLDDKVKKYGKAQKIKRKHQKYCIWINIVMV